jgi:hypothetical protein
MVTAIIETSVVIDLLRAYSPAVNWYASQSNSQLAITPLSGWK